MLNEAPPARRMPCGPAQAMPKRRPSCRLSLAAAPFAVARISTRENAQRLIALLPSPSPAFAVKQTLRGKASPRARRSKTPDDYQCRRH
jgi:hypothetical protein